MSWHGDYDATFSVASPPATPAAVKAAIEKEILGQNKQGKSHDLGGTVGTQTIKKFEVSGGPAYEAKIGLEHRGGVTLTPAVVAAALQAKFNNFTFPVDGEQHTIQGLHVTFAHVH